MTEVQNNSKHITLASLNASSSTRGILSMSLGFSLISKIKKESVSFDTPTLSFLDFTNNHGGFFYVII